MVVVTIVTITTSVVVVWSHCYGASDSPRLGSSGWQPLALLPGSFRAVCTPFLGTPTPLECVRFRQVTLAQCTLVALAGALVSAEFPMPFRRHALQTRGTIVATMLVVGGAATVAATRDQAADARLPVHAPAPGDAHPGPCDGSTAESVDAMAFPVGTRTSSYEQVRDAVRPAFGGKTRALSIDAPPATPMLRAYPVLLYASEANSPTQIFVRGVTEPLVHSRTAGAFHAGPWSWCSVGAIHLSNDNDIAQAINLNWTLEEAIARSRLAPLNPSLVVHDSYEGSIGGATAVLRLAGRTQLLGALFFTTGSHDGTAIALAGGLEADGAARLYDVHHRYRLEVRSTPNGAVLIGNWGELPGESFVQLARLTPLSAATTAPVSIIERRYRVPTRTDVSKGVFCPAWRVLEQPLGAFERAAEPRLLRALLWSERDTRYAPSRVSQSVEFNRDGILSIAEEVQEQFDTSRDCNDPDRWITYQSAYNYKVPWGRC